MSKTKSLIAGLYLCLILLIIFVGLLIYINVYGQLNIPLIFEIKPKDENKDFFQFSAVEELNRRQFSFYSEINPSINDNIQTQYNIKTIITDENYAKLYNLNLIDGSFFNRYMVEDKKHYVVISENLAREIFAFETAVGKSLYIDDYKYDVIGIYKSDNGYWARLSCDKYERIFIPYTAYSDYSGQKINAVAFKNDRNAYTNVDKIKKSYPDLHANFEQIDYKEKRSYSTQFITLLLSLIQMITIIYIIKFIYNIAADYIKDLLLHKDAYYFKELLMHNKRHLFRTALVAAVGIAVIMVLYNQLHFEVVMSDWFTPKENLFDLSHYAQKILAFFTHENSRNAIGNDYLYKLVNITLYSSIILSFFILPCMLLFLNKLTKLIKTKYVITLEMMGYLIIALIVCFAFNIYSASDYLKNILSVLIYFIIMLVMVFLNSFYNAKIK